MFMRIEVGNATAQGDRTTQEDSFCFTSMDDPAYVEHAGVMAVVTDGMGGLAGGREASHLAAQAMRQAYERKSPADTIQEALLSSLGKANSAVWELNQSLGRDEKAGTTLVAAVMRAEGLHWVSVGDSRLYLLRGSELTKLTVEHNFEQELMQRVARGEMTVEEARRHKQRHALTSFVGQRVLKKIDRSLQPLPLRTGDRVMLCSDGLYGTLTDEMIAELLNGEPQDAADRLIRATIEREKSHQDNTTVLIMAVQSEREGSLLERAMRVFRNFMVELRPMKPKRSACRTDRSYFSGIASADGSRTTRSHCPAQSGYRSLPRISNRFRIWMALGQPCRSDLVE